MKFNPVILNKTREGLSKSGVYYSRTDGGVFKAIKCIYLISILWVDFFCLLMVLGNAMRLRKTDTLYTNTEISTMRGGLYFSAMLAVLLIVCGVFVLFKKHIVPASASVLLSVIGIIFYYNIYENNIVAKGTASPYYLYYALPLVLIAVSSIVMLAINIRQNIIEAKAYELFSEKLYDNFRDRANRLSNNSESPFALTEKEWEEFIDKTDLSFPKKEKKNKKSN